MGGVCLHFAMYRYTHHTTLVEAHTQKAVRTALEHCTDGLITAFL